MDKDPETLARSANQQTPGKIDSTLAEVLQAIEAAQERLQAIERRTAEMERNLVVQQSMLDGRLLRLETKRLFTLWNTIAVKSRNALRSAASALGRSPLHALAGGERSRARYATWLAGEQAGMPSPEEARAASENWTPQPSISLLLVIRSSRGLAETLQSIRDQVYPNWELCLVLDKECESQVLPLVQDFEAKCGSVRHLVAAASNDAVVLNAAADLASGEYLSFLDAAGTLSPFALYYLAEAIHSSAPDLLYTDEDLLDAGSRHFRPVFKPDWSPDLLTSCMYMGHLLAVRREAFRKAGGLRPEYDGAHLHDLALRLADTPVRIHHVARVLYHTGPSGQTAPNRDPSSGAPAARRAIVDAIARREGIASECVPGPEQGTFLVRRSRPCGETTVIICSKSPHLVRKCLASLRAAPNEKVARVIVVAHEESGPDPYLRRVIQQAGATVAPFAGAFNFSAMNNLGAGLADTPNLLFLNDDVEATSPEWVDMLSEQLSRKEVGVAGATLWYPSRTLQHAGLVAGMGDGVGHAGRYAFSSDIWPWLLATRNVSAVTGACLAIRKELFEQLDGFDPVFPDNYNDVDLCFRVRARGLEVVCVPVAGLIHHECKTRRGIVHFEERYEFYKRWADILGRPDPYYSLSLAPTEEIALNLEHHPWHHKLLGPGTASSR